LIVDQCESLEYGGKIYYYYPQEESSWWWVVQLLGWFDEYFLWYKDRSIVADPQHYRSLFTLNGMFFPLIMVDGQIVWTRKRLWKGKKLAVTISALPDISLPIELILEKIEQYAQFWGAQEWNL
jgi:hypothetical protein